MGTLPTRFLKAANGSAGFEQEGSRSLDEALGALETAPEGELRAYRARLAALLARVDAEEAGDTVRVEPVGDGIVSASSSSQVPPRSQPWACGDAAPVLRPPLAAQ